MNIWILNHYAVTPDLPGGTRHFDIATEMVACGNAVTIFASSFHYSRLADLKLNSHEIFRVENVRGVKMIWLKTFPYCRNDWRRVVNMISYFFRAWWAGRRLPRSNDSIAAPDLVLGSSVHLLAVFAAYLLARRYHVPFFMEIRDLWPQTLVDMGKLRKGSPVTRCLYALERFLMKRADRIIVLLPYACEYITAKGIPKERICWIPNGVNLDQFGELEFPLRSKDEFRVLYMGSHGQANALDVFLQAARIVQIRQANRAKFVLVGGGTEKVRLMAMADELGLRNTEFLEPVPKNRVRETLEHADALLFILDKVGVFKYGISPNKLFDYMAAGRPILLCVEARNNPVAESHCGLTVPPQNPEALAEAILDLIRRPDEELADMGRRGRAYIQAHHDCRRLALRLIRCIEEARTDAQPS